MADGVNASVFGYVDQDEVIKRIDVVKDDDLASRFFGDSLQEIEIAATDIFDIGVRDEAETDAHSATHPFAVPTAAAPAIPPPAPAPPQPASTAPAPTLLDQDAMARQAFILGGPSAMKKD